jgi:hypothetical protein
MVPGYPTWPDSYAAVRAAVATGVDFIEFPIMLDRRFTSRTSGAVAEALTSAPPEACDPRSAPLRDWLAEIPAPVGVVYESAWPAAGDCRIPAIVRNRCLGLICEHNAPFAAYAEAARQWDMPLVPTLQASSGTVDDDERQVLDHGQGFVYLALSSATGRHRHIDDTVARKVKAIHAECPDLPVFLAFGLRSPEDVALAARVGADGFIIGSHALRVLGSTGVGAFERWLRSMIEASRRTPQPRSS